MALKDKPTSGSQWGDRKVSRAYYNSRRIQLKQPKNISIDLVREALSFIPADLPRSEWVKIGMAIKSAFPDGFDLYDKWSQRSKTYNSKDIRTTWRSIKAVGGISIKTLFYFAKRYGFEGKLNFYSNNEHIKSVQSEQAGNDSRIEIECTARKSQETWEMAKPVSNDFLYLKRKRIFAHGVGEIDGQYKSLPYPAKGKGSVLVIPLHDINGRVWSIQFITATGQKFFIQGPKPKGIFYRIGKESSDFAIGEGFATCASYYQYSGQTIYCAFTAGALLCVSQCLRSAYPHASIRFIADDDWKNPSNPGVTYALSAAAQISAKVFVPNFEGLKRTPEHVDFNDWILERRGNAGY